MMKTYFKTIFALSFCIVAISACKKYNTPPQIFEELRTDTSSRRKVMVISIDGLSGADLKSLQPTNIKALLSHSKYNYDVLKSGVGTDAATWASMMTGVSYGKHQISDDSFELPYDQSNGLGATVSNYKNVLNYITEYRATKTAVITPWANLRKYMINADEAPVVSTDLAAKNSTLELINGNEDIGVFVVNFKDVEKAGLNGGFSLSNANYLAAATKADEYVGNIVDAIVARKSYAKEDWLIMVTSDHGGSSAMPTNGFLVANNKNFQPTEMKKNGFNTILFSGTTIMATVPNDRDLYNGAGLDQDFTIQMQVRFNATSLSYVGILSRGSGYFSSAEETGWTIGTYSTTWQTYLPGSYSALNTKAINDSKWHTITMTSKRVNPTTRTVSLYTDGVIAATNYNWQGRNLSTTAPLKIGYNPVDTYTAVDFYAANLAYFNTALTETEISSNLALKDITQHPRYANLVGYWPIDDGAENTIANKAPGGYNMILQGNYSWKGLGNDAPPANVIDPNITGKSYALSSGTVGATMLYWMNVKIQSSYGIDANLFLNDFELEFLK